MVCPTCPSQIASGIADPSDMGARCITRSPMLKPLAIMIDLSSEELYMATKLS